MGKWKGFPVLHKTLSMFQDIEMYTQIYVSLFLKTTNIFYAKFEMNFML